MTYASGTDAALNQRAYRLAGYTVGPVQFNHAIKRYFFMIDCEYCRVDMQS